MTKKKKSNNAGIDLIENPDVLVGKAEVFFSNKRNQNIFYGIAVAILLLVMAFIYVRNQQISNSKEAQEEMFQAVYYFEKDSLGSALNGDGNNYGFLDIIDQYPNTLAANIAKYYTGFIYLKLRDYENSIRYLSDFNANDYIVQARAYSLIGDAYMEQDLIKDAIPVYKKAVQYKPNKEYTPIYLKKLALAYEEIGDFKSASKIYNMIITEYNKSPLFQDALKQNARLNSMALN